MDSNRVGDYPPAYGKDGQPVVTQPATYNPGPSGGGAPPQGDQLPWMPRPEALPGYPSGLEYLSQMDKLIVRQQKAPIEMMTRMILSNSYKVVNTEGQQVYFITEESDHMIRQYRGETRPFILHITDNSGQEVIRVDRKDKSRCSAACCGCTEYCSSEMTVESPPGHVVGYIKQGTGQPPKFHIMDASHQEVLLVNGPGGSCSCCFGCFPQCVSKIEFEINEHGDEVGKISKDFLTFSTSQTFTSADDFFMSFPRHLDVKMKATLIALTVLLDFLYFERIQPAATHHPGMANAVLMQHQQQQLMMQQQQLMNQQQQQQQQQQYHMR